MPVHHRNKSLKFLHSYNLLSSQEGSVASAVQKLCTLCATEGGGGGGPEISSPPPTHTHPESNDVIIALTHNNKAQTCMSL